MNERVSPPQSAYDEAADERLKALGAHVDLDAFHAVWLLHQAADAARQAAVEQVLDDVGISWTQFEVLWNMWIFGEREAGWISQAAMVSKSGLTTILRQLGNRGLVSRKTSAADRRKVLVALSPKGDAFMMRLFPRFNETEVAFTASLSQAQKTQLTTLLRELLADR